MPAPARIANAPICAYHGNFVRLMSIAIATQPYREIFDAFYVANCRLLPIFLFPGSPLFTRDLSALFWRWRRRWLLKLRFDAELDQLERRLRQRFDLTADNVDRLLEVARSLQVRHEIGQACDRHAPAIDSHGIVGLFEGRQPQHRRKRPTDFIEHVHRTRLVLAKLLDEDDSLLKLRLPLFELLDVLNDRVQSCRFLLSLGDVFIELRRFLLDRPISPADDECRDDQDRAAPDRQLMAGLKRDGTLDRFAFDGKEVDFDHRSPALLIARPTATAAVGTTLATSPTPSLLGSKVTFLNGSKASTGAPNRS